jgi:hypothetical protein
MQQWETPQIIEEFATKQCASAFKHWKPLSEFRGENKTCNECIARTSAYSRKRLADNPEETRRVRRLNAAKWAAKNLERRREIGRNYKYRKPVEHMLKSARRRAAINDLPFNITSEDIKIPAVCPILGIELKPCRGRLGDSSPSLDRIIPHNGYVKGNVAVISQKANQMKSNGTAAQHEAIAKWIRANGGE